MVESPYLMDDQDFDEGHENEEHDASFIFSGNTVVPPEIIEFYKTSFVQEPITKGGFDGNLWIWEYPDYSRNYIVSADVARGDGADYSAFQVIDVESMTQVAEYKGQLGTKDYGNFLVSVATDYNNALLIIENANIGWAVLQQIIDKKNEKIRNRYQLVINTIKNNKIKNVYWNLRKKAL